MGPGRHLSCRKGASGSLTTHKLQRRSCAFATCARACSYEARLAMEQPLQLNDLPIDALREVYKHVDLPYVLKLVLPPSAVKGEREPLRRLGEGQEKRQGGIMHALVQGPRRPLLLLVILMGADVVVHRLIHRHRLAEHDAALQTHPIADEWSQPVIGAFVGFGEGASALTMR